MVSSFPISDQRSNRILLPVLVMTGFVVSIIGMLGALMIPTIARERHVSLETAQWLLTVTLLIGAVASPIFGRLADGPKRRRVIISTLTAVLIGSVIAALATNFWILLFGRALQGLGQSLIPLAIAVARDHLPREKIRGGVAILSVTTAAGAGLGYPITGLIAESLSYQAGFWFAACVTLTALVAVVLVVPNNRGATANPLDTGGAVLLSIALLALLLGISQGGTWDWTSPVILGLFSLAIVSAVVWARHEWHQRFPLIDLHLVTRPMVLAADAAALLLGIALYAMSSLVNRYLQTPSAAGYGFDSSLVVVGLVLLPLSIGSLAASRLSGALTRRFGPGKVVAAGAIIVGLDMAYLALTRQFIWEFALAVLILGIGIGLSFAMMPALIIRSVPPEETGSATGLNQVLRLVGGSIGSAASIAILASHHQPGLPYPEDVGYTIAFLAGAVICFMAAVVCLLLVREPADEPEPTVVVHESPNQAAGDT